MVKEKDGYQQGPSIEHRELCWVLCGIVGPEGEFGGERIHVCVYVLLLST